MHLILIIHTLCLYRPVWTFWQHLRRFGQKANANSVSNLIVLWLIILHHYIISIVKHYYRKVNVGRPN